MNNNNRGRKPSIKVKNTYIKKEFMTHKEIINHILSHRIQYVLMKGDCKRKYTLKGKAIQDYLSNSNNFVEVEDLDNEYQECKQLPSRNNVIYKLISCNGDIIYLAINKKWININNNHLKI